MRNRASPSRDDRARRGDGDEAVQGVRRGAGTNRQSERLESGSPSSMSRREATTPTSAASRRDRCRPTRRTSTRKACCSTTCSSSPQAGFSRPRCARSSRRAGTRRATSTRTWPTCARRSPRARRVREELAKMVAHFGLPVVRAYMRHVQDNAEESVRRVLDVLKDGHFEYEMDSGATIAVHDLDRQGAAPRDDRLHRHERAAADQLQRAVRRVQGGGALRVPHAGRRRHPDECRLPEAARHRDSRGLDAGAALSGRRGRRQRRDVAGDHRRAVRRARRARGVAGHDEQLHVRQRDVPVLRDDLRRLGRRTRFRRRERRADAHDQFAAHRSRKCSNGASRCGSSRTRSAAAAAAQAGIAAATAACGACASSSR